MEPGFSQVGDYRVFVGVQSALHAFSKEQFTCKKKAVEWIS